MMICKICKTESQAHFRHQILNKYDIQYFLCPNCHFLQTEDPFWMEEAYQQSINLSDTGLVNRNINYSRTVTLLSSLFFDKTAKYLDYAGGYGLFTRLLRDVGLDCYWSDKFTPNLLAKGFEDTAENSYELITAFEAFEHFLDPLSEIEEMLSKSDSIIFSTEIFTGTPPEPGSWNYYGFAHGQHISLYSINTLKYLSERYELHLYTNNRGFHLLTKKKIPGWIFSLSVKFGEKASIHSVVRKLFQSKTIKDHERLLSS